MIAKDRKDWEDRIEDLTEESIEAHMHQYRNTRRLWKQESQSHLEAIENRIREREKRITLANEEIAKLQAEVQGQTKI